MKFTQYITFECYQYSIDVILHFRHLTVYIRGFTLVRKCGFDVDAKSNKTFSFIFCRCSVTRCLITCFKILETITTICFLGIVFQWMALLYIVTSMLCWHCTRSSWETRQRNKNTNSNKLAHFYNYIYQLDT